MSASSYQAAIGLEPTEQAVVDLVRIGLSGDAASVRQLARRMLRRQTASVYSQALRDQLSSIILTQDQAVLRSARPPTPVQTDGQLALATVEDQMLEDPPILTAEAQAAVDTLIDERRQAARLIDLGLEPPKSLLLQGPPGVGKTLTARHLARELSLPLVTIELAALMSSLLGQTGQNLRQLLDHARSFPCVLLLDEFDALAKRRDDQSDIGELKRLVNVLLLELERWPDTGLLIAATNHPQLLDPAVERRFDLTLTLTVPGQRERAAILSRVLQRAGLEVADDLLAACALAFDGISGAGIERETAAIARAAVLSSGDAATVIAQLAVDRLREQVGDHAGRRSASAIAPSAKSSASRTRLSPSSRANGGQARSCPRSPSRCIRWRRSKPSPTARSLPAVRHSTARPSVPAAAARSTTRGPSRRPVSS
jgi:MoxR-like ATPase